jgi:hypothetical protein
MHRVRRFRLKFFFASKRNEAKRDPFRFVFACSSENTGPIFSLVFASFRFEFFVSLRSEKKKTIFSLRFALQIFSSLHFCNYKYMNIIYTVSKAVLWIRIFFLYGSGSLQKISVRLQWLRLLLCYVVS